MGTDLPARELFDLVDAITDLPISRFCAKGPLERLTETDVAQPAVVTTSLAALRVLRDEVEFDAVAGHSVGEIAAYVAAGALDEENGLRLVHARAQAMAEACRKVDGTMAAVLGLDEGALREVCLRATINGSTVEVANLNAPGQLIVSGARDAIQRVTDAAKDAGAKRVMPLNVGGPFHSAYMRPAAETFSTAIDATTFRDARLPVVLNASASEATDAETLRDELRLQIYSPVRWVESLLRLAQMGCDRFVEVGPGTVLAGMVKRTLPDARVTSFAAMRDLDKVRALLA
jgi:[acyl-carrier-protein] S-malonyltransferase